MNKIPSSEITPEGTYLSRRKFVWGVGAVLLGSALAACVGPGQPAGSDRPHQTGDNAEQPAQGAPARAVSSSAASSTTAAATPDAAAPSAARAVDELGDKLTPYKAVTTYNNYYEFAESKDAPALMSANFKVAPWTVQVGGLVNNPKTYGVEDLIRKFSPEERIYRLRCVEAWSMVIPWLGFPLSKLLREVEPAPGAKYVQFTTLLDPEQMPGQKSPWYRWPYVEGLRIDEAMNDLVLLSTGLYGKMLEPQNGAPIRVVVPWKYGFKNIKAIVKIDLVAEQPTSLWMAAAPDEYGFYANVNPDVPHPRWSQASERRIGELSRRRTLPFNGYAEQVAALYTGMDLAKYY
jgi:methionine sulfoxide reductase catalytic subunit